MKKTQKKYVPDSLYYTVNLNNSPFCYVVIRHKISGVVISVMLKDSDGYLFRHVSDYGKQAVIKEKDPDSYELFTAMLRWLTAKDLTPMVFPSCDKAEEFLITNLKINTDLQLDHIALTDRVVNGVNSH